MEYKCLCLLFTSDGFNIVNEHLEIALTLFGSLINIRIPRDTMTFIWF